MLVSKKSALPRVSAELAVAAHPFLIVRKPDYAALQARAADWPWDEQKAAALHDAATMSYHPAARIDVRAITLAKLLSTTALAYILDPERRDRHVARIVEYLRAFDPAEPNSITAEMRANPDKTLWRYAVPTGNAFFQGVLALDIIHDDLSADRLAEIESFLRDGPARYFRETALAWKQGTHAAAAIFALYERDAAVYGPIVEAWKHHTLKAITEDGVFIGGAAYADARWSYADRENKALFGDVLAHAGVLPDWYDEPKIGKFMEWLNGYAYTPFRVLWTFGDSGPDKFNGNYQPGGERAYRYSPLAARYAAWLRDGLTPPGALGSYVLTAEPPAEPAAAPSRIFTDGGAWLKETSADRRSLSAGLWNVATPGDAHAHKETNSVCIAAYGELLLRASGYCGWATPEKGFSWAYIHDRAIAGNTALFDYAVPATEAEERLPSAVNDHVRTAGAGITASMLTGRIDFARGDSGDAIPNGRHVRDFVFVHPADGAGGYYVAFDDLTAAPGATGHIIWHPSSSACATTAEKQEYTWTTDEFGGAPVNLTLFLATRPDEVLIRNGVLANWGDGLVGKYLVGNYPLDTGRRRVMTILFPHDARVPKADMACFRSDDGVWTGATVRQGGVTDWLFQTEGDAVGILVPGLTVRARAGCLRQRGEGHPIALWLMDSLAFSSTEFDFTSDVPLTLFYGDGNLQVTAQEAACVQIRGGPLGDDGLRQIRLNGGSTVRVLGKNQADIEITF